MDTGDGVTRGVPAALASSTQTALSQDGITQFAWLDSLRGVAILGVVLVHSSALAKPAGLLRDALTIGQRGVQLFYVLSAFTIFLSLDRRRARGETSLLPFFLRRICRIAPLFYVAIAANFAFFYAGESIQGAHPELVDLPLALLFLHGLKPTAINSIAIGGWSIAVEAMFYMVAPWLYLRSDRLSSTAALYGLLAIVCIAVSWYLGVHATDSWTGEYFTFLWFPVELPVFLIGILTYRWWKRSVEGPAGLAATLGPGVRRLVSLELLALSVALLALSLPTSNWTLHLATMAFSPLLIGIALHPWRLVVNGVTRFLGRISFSIYLMHFFCLGLTARILVFVDHAAFRVIHGASGASIAFIVTLALAVPLSTLTHRWIEKPGIRFGSALIRIFRSDRRRVVHQGHGRDGNNAYLAIGISRHPGDLA